MGACDVDAGPLSKILLKFSQLRGPSTDPVAFYILGAKGAKVQNI